MSLARHRNTDDLPGTREEIKAISKILEGNYFFGANADEANFKKIYIITKFYLLLYMTMWIMNVLKIQNFILQKEKILLKIIICNVMNFFHWIFQQNSLSLVYVMQEQEKSQK